jgi:hypothetical protein
LRTTKPFLALLFPLLLISPALAVSCALRTECLADETCVLSLYQRENSHAARCGYYEHEICCTDLRSSTLSTACVGDEQEVLSLYQPEDSHVAGPGYYAWRLCLDWFNCTIRLACEPYEAILASVYQPEDSHIARWDYYPYKLCCGDCDVAPSYCRACFDLNILSPGCLDWSCWFLGGDQPGALACCGDDDFEFKATRVCLAGVCPSDPTDDACCNYVDDCVWDNACYRDGFVGDVNGDGVNEFCDAGIWTRPLPPWKMLWRDLLRILARIIPV